MELSKYLFSAQNQQIVEKLSQIFTAKLFQIGTIKISLSFISNLAFQSLFVFFIAGLIKSVVKNRLLNRFGLDLGTREAISSIINYIIISVGLIVALQNVGINLETLAVVLGAIGFVLAFGLQGLSSDLAGGVTLLFEQPVKVGDFIQVEEWSGTVEKIAIRSTVIRTVKGNAVVIPNTIITARNVVNWSYQTSECCVEIAVRMPRSSDPLFITETLLSIARKESRVLSSPSPKVYLKGIDDDALNFELLVWINKPSEMDSIKSSLYFLVELEFQTPEFQRQQNHTAKTNVNINSLAASSSLLPQVKNSENNHSAFTEAYAIPSNLALAEEINSEKDSDILKHPITATLSEFLRKVCYFEKLNDIELRQIIEEGYRKNLDAFEIVCRENDPGDSFYIILSGSVEVFVESIGKQVAIRQPGEFIGEMSLLMGTPRTATLRTLSRTTLFVVDRGNLQSLLKKHQGLADTISEELSKRQETLESLGIKIDSSNKQETSFIQIRKRIQSLFGI
ncbi:cyclic nucleotide-binding domain-containing protein [Nostoc sp.]|uniref:cyclic nucleotide-binding domain-containing protein n=1 Tax=Nostoc sp. TaxID=1180 RepID=UPI002FFC84DC